MALKGAEAASQTHTALQDPRIPPPAFTEHLLCADPGLGAEHVLRKKQILSSVWWGEMETLLPCDEDVLELWGHSWGVTNSEPDLGLE